MEAAKPLKLMTASEERLHIIGYIQAPIKLGELELGHEFVVVNSLVAPVILGVDFLHANSLVLAFTQSPVMVCHVEPTSKPSPNLIRHSNRFFLYMRLRGKCMQEPVPSLHWRN